MKIVLKYALLAIVFLLVACGNSNMEKDKAVNKATPAIEASNPILIEKKVNETAVEVPPTTEVVKSEIPVVAPPTKEDGTPKVIKINQPKTTDKKVVIEKKSVPTKEIAKPIETPKATVPQPEKTVVEPVKETPQPASPKVTVEETPVKKEVVQSVPTAFSHEAWNQLTQKHISSTGKVNYKGFKVDLPAFEAYLKALADNPVANSASRGEKMAYWINAYNAFTIKLIVDNYPVSSITKLHGGKPWDVKWIKLGDKTYSLNNIEHDILRPQFKDARIHFAVNCAAQSCPPVLNKAWTAENLNSNLERSAKQFINNTKYNTIGAKEVTISKIFDWYKEDFGNIVEYLNKYADTKINAGATVKYADYNWALNE